MSLRLGWREQQHLSSDVYCKALTWQNHSSLRSARLRTASLLMYHRHLTKPTDKILFHFLLSFVWYISFCQAAVFLLFFLFQRKRIWSRSTFNVCDVHFFFFFLNFDMSYLFLLWLGGCLKKRSRLVTQVFLFFFAVCFLLHCCWICMKHVCKYQPLKARTQNTRM